MKLGDPGFTVLFPFPIPHCLFPFNPFPIPDSRFPPQ
jgi:hypothetical protein